MRTTAWTRRRFGSTAASSGNPKAVAREQGGDRLLLEGRRRREAEGRDGAQEGLGEVKVGEGRARHDSGGMHLDIGVVDGHGKVKVKWHRQG